MEGYQIPCLKHTDGGTGSSSRALPVPYHGCGLRCPRCMLPPPPLLGALTELLKDSDCIPTENPIPNKPTFPSRQFLFCLISVHATFFTGNCTDPLGQKSESTAISGWQHLHSLFHPRRSYPSLQHNLHDQKGTLEVFTNSFFRAATKNTALL